MTTSANTFWTRIAPKYATDPIKDQAAYDYTLGRTLSYLSPQSRVLELGCGTASTALKIAPHVKHLIATDVAEGMIQIGRDKVRDAHLKNVELRVAEAAQAITQAGPVDAILAFNLFHLLPNHPQVIAAAAEALPVGGYLISKTACLSDPGLGLKRFAFRAIVPVMQVFGKAPPVEFFTEPALEGVLQDAGFDIVEAGNFPAMARYIVARKT